MTSDTRTILKGKQSEFLAAESALAASRQAMERAQALLATVTRAAEDHTAGEKRDEAARTEQILAALKAGVTPSFNDKTLAKHSAARADIEARRSSALQVVEQLRAEEVDAERLVEISREAVNSAAKAIVREAASALADEWVVAEAKARSLRLKLGRHHGPVSRLGGAAAVGAAIAANESEDRFDLGENQAFSSAWEDFAAALQRDPGARLEFTQAEAWAAERAAESVRSEARIASINSRMRGEAA